MKTSSSLLFAAVAFAAGAVTAHFLFPGAAPAAEKPVAVATSDKPAAPVIPEAKSAPAQVAAPAVAPAPAKTVASASVTPPVPNTAPAVAADAGSAAPPAAGATPPELTNVITEMNGLVQGGDLVSVYENYMPPQKMAALTPEQKDFIENQIRTQLQGPNGAKVLQAQQQMIQALSSITPTMNAAGDHATFQVPTPKDLAPAGANLPPTLPVNFIKIDGKWYLDQ